MKIRMLTGICGPDIDLAPKAETESFSDAEALRLMLSDQAEPADQESAAALAEARESDGGLAPPPAPPAPPAPKPDELDAIGNTMKLKALAKGEGIEVGAAKSAVEIRAAIRAGRAAKAA